MRIVSLLAIVVALQFMLIGNQASCNDNTDGKIEINPTVDGIGVFPLSEQTWRSELMSYPGNSGKDMVRIWTGPDFFTFEYKEPFDFSKGDLLKKYGWIKDADYKVEDNAMVLNTGKKGFTFGFGDNSYFKDHLSNRFGVCWGPNLKDRIRLRMEIEQDKPTEWLFAVEPSKMHREKKYSTKFKINKTGNIEFETDTIFVRNITPRTPIDGFKLVCLTADANIKIKSLKIAPSSANIYYRKKFEIKTKPVIAHATYSVYPNYDLYLNGEKIDSGNKIYPTGFQKTLDLLPYLKTGENIIAYRNEFLDWSIADRTALMFEGIAVDKTGSVTRILSGNDWKCSMTADAEWINSNYDDSKWKTPQLSKYVNNMDRVNTKVSRGLNPKHMGLLDVTLVDRQYPVFDYTENPQFNLRIPIGVKNKLIPELLLYKAGTNDLVLKTQAQSKTDDENFANYNLTLDKQEVGPYRLIWRLVDISGKTTEVNREEMVVVGPIKQDTLVMSKFDDEFEKRLKLVSKIDCSKETNNPEKFLDHSGMYNPAKQNKGRVVNNGNLIYRETGSGCFDYFSYTVDLKERGRPYLIEVIIPDDIERYTYSGILELHPVRYSNNAPKTAIWSSTGSCLSGGRFPLTDKTRKIRYIYYPSSNTAAVVVMNGRKDSRAAASEINIYKIDGELPALKLPETDRLLGTHNERLSVMAATMSCENPTENDLQLMNSGHRDSWYNWYKIFERKIKLLRFQGRNMTVEGLYMYSKSDYPSINNSYGVSNQEFDVAYLGFKMYEHNNINCLISFEYMSNPAMMVDNIDTTSNRRMILGEDSLQKVTRTGKQLSGQAHAGVNFMHPKVKKYYMDIFKEIRDRYKSVKSVRGIMNVIGNWYLPGFGMCGFKEFMPIDIGYGDYTVSLFEKETGIKLELSATDPKRFEKRYDILTGKYNKEWINWRTEKVKSCFKDIQAVLSDGDNPWDLKIYPAFKQEQLDNNLYFKKPAENRSAVNSALTDFLNESAVPLEQYLKNPNLSMITPLMTIGFKGRFSGERVISHQAWDTNPGALEVVRKNNSFYFNTALDEVDCPALKATKWPWKNTRRGVFVARGVEDNRMNGFVNVLAHTTPKMIITQWMDCNMETAANPQIRRFALEHYVTPDAEFSTLADNRSHGVIAQTAKKDTKGTYLRLVNNSPYTSIGTVNSGTATIRDLVYDNVIKANEKITLKPNDIRTFYISGSTTDEISCNFNFTQETEKQLHEKTKSIIENSQTMNHLPKDKAALLQESFAKKDAFREYILLDDYEVASCIKTIMEKYEAQKNQLKFEEDLRKYGKAQIDFGAFTEHTTSGHQRWLPDQTYHNSGSYGNAGATFVNRGNIQIENTDEDKVFQTEVFGGKVNYYIPLPNGKYKVTIYTAETFDKINRPGMREYSIQIQNKLFKDKVDPFELSGGYAKAYLIAEDNVVITDGLLNVEFVGSVCVHGLAIEKIK